MSGEILDYSHEKVLFYWEPLLAKASFSDPELFCLKQIKSLSLKVVEDLPLAQN